MTLNKRKQLLRNVAIASINAGLANHHFDSDHSLVPLKISDYCFVFNNVIIQVKSTNTTNASVYFEVIVKYDNPYMRLTFFTKNEDGFVEISRPRCKVFRKDIKSRDFINHSPGPLPRGYEPRWLSGF
jgi:hypothetical protein